MLAVALQTDITWESPGANLSAIGAAVRQAGPPPGAMVVLPELCSTGFSMDAPRLAEPPGGRTESALAAIAREYQVHLVAGLAVATRDGTTANQAIGWLPDGSAAFRYTKLHPFSLAGEADTFPAGDSLVTANWGGLTVAPLICYDLRFPEVFRTAAAAGADTFVVIANWPARRHEHWLVLARARAIENQAYVVAVNRCGNDPDFTYAGGTTVFGPQGETLASASSEPCVVRAELSPAAIAGWRDQFPAQRDRRPDAPAVTRAGS